VDHICKNPSILDAELGRLGPAHPGLYSDILSQNPKTFPPPSQKEEGSQIINLDLTFHLSHQKKKKQTLNKQKVGSSLEQRLLFVLKKIRIGKPLARLTKRGRKREVSND
jgi:hypothetical protein